MTKFSLGEIHRKLFEQQSAAGQFVSLALLPLGWLYGLAGAAKALLYRSGLKKAYRAAVPVISVGNLSVGGTGKTPVCDHLLKKLLARGKRVALVSRGYGGQGAGRVGVVSAGEGLLLEARTCGDEPFLLARNNPGALVFVAPRRADGVRMAVEQYGAEVIVLDDGFQHQAVHRDLNIVLLDASRPLSNGRVLPAGRLREFPRALGRSDLVLLTRSRGDERLNLPLAVPIMRCRHVLGALAFSLEGQSVGFDQLQDKAGLAFAGIAQPDLFFSSLTARGLRLERRLSLPDHVCYDEELLHRLSSSADRSDYLVTTEKDAVKLQASDFKLPCYQVPMSIEFFGEDSLDAVLDELLKGSTQ